jgi:hypothetical protein
MLSNKILPDESRAGQENKAHVGKAGRYQQMTPCDGTGSAVARPANDLPAGGICSSTPMTLDPHAGARRSNDNVRVKEGEVSRSARTTEIHRRLEDRTPRYKY